MPDKAISLDEQAYKDHIHQSRLAYEQHRKEVDERLNGPKVKRKSKLKTFFDVLALVVIGLFVKNK